LDIFNWRSARQTEKIIKALKPDVVHTHNLMGLGFAIPNLIWRRALRHVHTVHDVQLLHPSGLLPNDWRPRWPHEWAYVLLMRRMMGSPTVVIFPSEFAKEQHERYGFFAKSTKVVLRNPAPSIVKVERVEAGDNFLFVGQLEEHKGVLDLLDAWAKWGDREDARLTVVGDGTLRPAVSERIASLDGVTYVGPVFGEELNQYFDEVSCLVMPSRVMENAPMVILQAMSRGLPVLAARSGGIPELVTENKTGWLFEPGDVDGLVAGLQTASLFSERSVMSQAAQEAIASLGEEAHLDGLKSVYNV
jgi:glycosyltransferase involved in cell wall biosynthesis